MEKHELDDFTKDLNAAFNGKETKKNTTIKETEKTSIRNPIVEKTIKIIEETKRKNEIKKLKIVGWVASSLSIIGIIMNAYLIIWCWAVWIVSDFFWIYWATKKKEWSQVFLWVVFILANLYGWFLWATM